VFIYLTIQHMTFYGTSTSLCKLLQLLSDRHMLRMIMELLKNFSFTLTTNNVTRSRLWHLKNCVPHTHRDLSSPFSMMYTCDLPNTVFRK